MLKDIYNMSESERRVHIREKAANRVKKKMKNKLALRYTK